MKSVNKKFSARAVHHIYQRADDLGVIFYTYADRLVYYSIAATKAKHYGIKVLAASIMFTHIHQGIVAPSLKILRKYLQDTNSSFARLFNSHYSIKGKLFEKYPGRSQKETSKEIRSNLIYIYNNHVEKKLCREAVQQRWSFLAYAASSHPFSNEINKKSCSRALMKGIKLVDRRVRKKQGIEYFDLDRILPQLNTMEREEFIDYAISRYAWIDFPETISAFGNYDSMITTINSTTGGEYTINEEFSKHTDREFVELTQFAAQKGILNSILSLNHSQKAEYIMEAFRTTAAKPYHLKKFFHEDFTLSR